MAEAGVRPEVSGAAVDVAVMVPVGAFFALLFWRVVADRNRLPRSTRVVDAIIFEDFQTQDGKAAVEDIVYARESWTDDDKDGDDVGRRWAVADAEETTGSADRPTPGETVR